MSSHFRKSISCTVRCIRLLPINSTHEQEIIEHPSSCYVIGRSGTGKTTTMLFKMLAIQRTWQQYPDMAPKPCQVFVTQSRVLASRVEEYFVKLMASLETATYSPEELRKDVDQEIEYVDQDDNKQWRSDLPERFSGLSDEHFPLFITYDWVWVSSLSKYLISLFRGQLCAMLQRDMRRGNNDHGFVIPETAIPTSPTLPRKSGSHAGSGSTSSSNRFRRNFVSYHEFLASYWGHLPQTLTRGLGKKRWPIHILL